MTIDFAKARDIFTIAVEKSDRHEQSSYLDEACGADRELRQHLDRLLCAHEQTASFLDKGAVATLTAEFPLSETPGTIIGPYKLLQHIGEGGMGVVFMAEQCEPIQRTVALKIIKPGMDTRQVIARFEAERQAVAMMDHPNIAKVLDAGTTDSGRPYFVMELVKGVPITEYCDKQHLTIHQRLELMANVCQAVQHAHQKGVIHRDIKPTNILVAEYDGKPVPKVIDFGVAKAVAQRLTERTIFTEYGQIIGTFEYMSPEQARLNQLDVDTRSDVYSLGVLLYELLAGSTPLEKERLRTAAFDEILQIIGDEEPPPPSTRLGSAQSLPSIAANRRLEPEKLTGLISGELDWIVMRCLGKDRNARYASAIELAADLEHWLCDEPLTVRSLEAGYLLRIWIRRNLGSVGWALTLGVIWGVMGGLLCWFVMYDPLGLPLTLRRAIFVASIVVLSAGGMTTVLLVRPKNATADLISGAITGMLAAVICYTVSWGWLAIIVAGVPYGIWLGMLSAVVFMGSVCTTPTLAAGMLIRRHGSLRAAIGPYAELVLPSILALIFANGLAFNLIAGRAHDWQDYVLPTLVLGADSVAVLIRSHWIIRVSLHMAALVSLAIFATTQHVGL